MLNGIGLCKFCWLRGFIQIVRGEQKCSPKRGGRSKSEMGGGGGGGKSNEVKFRFINNP